MAPAQANWKVESPDGDGWIDVPAPVVPIRQPPLAWRARAARRAVALLMVLDASDVIVLAGLLLLARGCYLVAPAAGWAVPGAILLWYAMPQRPRFLQPKPPPVILAPPERPDHRSQR